MIFACTLNDGKISEWAFSDFMLVMEVDGRIQDQRDI